MDFIKNILRVSKLIYQHNFILNENESWYKSHIKNSQPSHNNKAKDILLLPTFYDFSNMNIIFSLSKIFAKEKNLKLKYFNTYTYLDERRDSTNIFKLTLKSLLSFNFIYINKIRCINNIRKKDVIFSNYFIYRARKSTKFILNSKNDVLNINYDSIQIGDLIYDHYLRFNKTPTVDIEDKYLIDLINYSQILVKKWEKLFNKFNIKTVLIPYTSYLHWGIPTRVALKHGIRVITYGSTNYILNEVTTDYPYHTKNYHLYKQIFSKITNTNEKIKVAENYIYNRLNGVVDETISYMAKSAYSSSTNEDNIFISHNQKQTAVIFLHCFFDSPHIYGDGLFVDFFEWINFLLTEALKNKNTLFFIKPHPNGLPENIEIVNSLKIQFEFSENIKFIEPTISNKQLLDLKPNAVFTYYGTVAHEFAYAGIPVITSGKNPHSEFNFIYNPINVEQLKYFINNVGSYGLPEKYNQNEIKIFYYMHYLYYNKKYDQLNYSNDKNIKVGKFEILPEYNLEDLIYN